MAAALWHARIDRLIQSLASMDATEIRTGAATARARDGDLTAELEWWRETVAVERELRRCHRSRDATMAAQRAVQALEIAAMRAGLATSDPDVRCLADAVRSVARATVIGYDGALERQTLAIGSTTPASAPAAHVARPELLDRRSA